MLFPVSKRSFASWEASRKCVPKRSFGGVVKEVSLAYVPEVIVGDYVVVHVGFAISKVDEEEANKTLEYLRQMDELLELEAPGTAEARTPPNPASGAG